ncbi:MAG: hypothetical protein AABN34_28540 [Acidobacteriota bacterium]
MNTSGLFSKMRGMRIVVVFLALLLAYGAVSYSPQASSTNVYSVDLGGVTGATNNTILAFGRYVVIAPFWPSKGLAENGDLDVSQLDNHSLYVIDTKKPDAPPLSKKITSSRDSEPGAPNTVYFPTRVLFDPPSSTVYVRGTRFEEKDGEVTPIDVIAYVHFSLDEAGKPVLDSNVVTFDIPGVSTEHTSEAPLDFALNGNGDTLVFTNGASLFSYNLAQGYLYSVAIVQPDAYGPDDSISFLNVDAATNVVSVCQNRRSVGEDTVTTVSSEISFYGLGVYGTFDPLKRTMPDQFPAGTALADGSNIAIVSHADSEFALFATSDGSLCAVDLEGDDKIATVKRLYSFPELAHYSESDASPLLIQYDSSKRVVGIVKPGYTVQIRRPTNAKGPGIRRPTNLHITSELAVLAMARLGKKNKVTSANSFTEDFKDEGGLSNFVSGQNSEWLIATYSGNLYSVGVAGDLQDSKPQLVGPIGSRVDRLDYYADRTSIVAISSFTLDEAGIRMASPGSLVVGKMPDLQSQSGGAILQALLPIAAALSTPAPSIRRPSNVKR